MPVTIAAIAASIDAIEKLTGIFGRLGELFSNALIHGVAGYTWLQESVVIDRLNELSATLTVLTAKQRIQFVPSVAAYLKDPNVDNWEDVRNGIKATAQVCTKVLGIVKEERLEIATQGFFKDLIMQMLERDKTLRELYAMDRPVTKIEMDALREHLNEYNALLDQLDKTNAALMAYFGSKGQLLKAS